MSSRKNLMIVILSNFCVIFAAGVYAWAQNADSSSEEAVPQPVIRTTTAAPTTSSSAATPSTTGTTSSAATPSTTGTTSTTATPSTTAGDPSTGDALIGVQRMQSSSQSLPRRNVIAQSSAAVQDSEAALKKAEEEMQKVEMQLDKMLKDLEKSGDQKAMQKARDEMQKAMQKYQEAMQKARASYDRTAKDIRSVQVLPGVNQPQMNGQIGPGYGASGWGIGGLGGPYGSGGGGGRVIMNDRTGRMIVSGPNNYSLEFVSSPEATELRGKEDKIQADTDVLAQKYNGAQSKEERATLKKQLQDKLNEQFDIRQNYRDLQVKRLEKELAQIRESIQKRNENREQIIKRRIAQLLREEDDLEF
jgi:hypothetical protein